MSIATEITRLQTAKANLKTQIEAKGVSVPSTATIDTYATYVQEIPQGGGSGETKDYFKITNRTSQSGIIMLYKNSNYDNVVKVKTTSDGINWTSHEITTDIIQITLPANGYVMFDGSENSLWALDSSKYISFGVNKNYDVSGKLSTLVGNCMGLCFYRLFANSTQLVDASGLQLDYLSLSDSAYNAMFKGCSGLIAAPSLPAMRLGSKCYYEMFKNCTSLTTAPELPATSLANNCYQNMFQGCTGLTTAPELPATSLAQYCYSYMFQGCTSLTTAPELPATTLQNYCYQNMFAGCNGLTTAPILSAPTLVSNCYASMFNYCTSLTSITCLAQNHQNGHTQYWVEGIATQGTFYCAEGYSSIWSQGSNGYPSSWSLQEYSPQTGVEIVINDAAMCIGGIPMECLDVSAYTYSIVSIDPNDGTTELETFASATIENAMYGESVRYEITDSATTSGITSITLDDSDGIKLTIVGEFDTANTYAVKCSTIGIDDGITRYGYAMDGDSNNNFDLSEDISVTPDFSTEIMPLRTLTIEGVPAVPNDATHIEVSDDDKFSIDISWDGSDVDTSVSTADEGSGDRITVNYVREEEAIIIEADWDDCGGEGSGVGEYNLRMKAETDSCTVEPGDEGTYSLQWSENELTKTITFDGGTCTPYE